MADLNTKCGSKPTCLGWSQGCKDKQSAYAACVKRNQLQGTVKWVIVGVIVIVLIIFTARFLRSRKKA